MLQPNDHHLERFFAGIGSRDTPVFFKAIMANLTYVLTTHLNYTLRSGAARGADSYFEAGLINNNQQSEIYAPKKGFGEIKSNAHRHILHNNMWAKMEAMSIIEKFNLHEKWKFLINSKSEKCSFAVAAHIRNVFQVLGDLTDGEKPVKFVCCWTPDGATEISDTTEDTGGTRSAIRLARHLDIPVFNLAKKEHGIRVVSFLNQYKNLPYKTPSLESLEEYYAKAA